VDDRFVEVARVQGPVEAELVRGLLVSYGITVRLGARVPHSVLPFTVDGLGEVRILVPAEDEDTANDLIARHRQAGLIVLDGEKPPHEAS